MIGNWVQLVRLRTTITAPILTAVGYAGSSGMAWRFEPLNVAILLLLSFSVIAFAQIFNDILDREADRTTKPERPIAARRISLKSAAVAAGIMATVGLVAAVVSGPVFVPYWLFATAGGAAYSLWLKGTVVFGNVLVAVIAASVYALPFIASGFNQNAFAGLLIATAFILGNELFKTSEDVVGDSMVGLKTIATTYSARNVALCILLCATSISLALILCMRLSLLTIYAGSAAVILIGAPTLISSIVAIRGAAGRDPLPRRAHLIWRLTWVPGLGSLLILAK